MLHWKNKLAVAAVVAAACIAAFGGVIGDGIGTFGFYW
jgi:hypothetical protein